MGKFWQWLRRITPLRIAMFVAVLFSLLHFVIESDVFEFGPLSQKGFIHQLDLKALDLKFHTRNTKDLPPPRVVIAAIDEKGVERYGLWPWRRSVIADFINAAGKGGAKVVAFDAVFSDEDRNASYVDIKHFLESFTENDLSPTSAGAQTLLQQISALESEHDAALEAMKKSVDGRPPPPAMTKALKQSDRAKQTLRKARASLASYYERANKFEAEMSHLVQAGSPDAALEGAIRQNPDTVLGYINFYSSDDIVGVKKEDLTAAAKHVEKVAITELYEEQFQEIGDSVIQSTVPVPNVDLSKLQISRVVAMRAPLPRFGKEAKYFGYFNADPDPDGPMRRIRLLNIYEGKIYPALSLITAARYLDAEIRPINGSFKPRITIDGVQLGERTVATNMHGHFLVNYYKDPGLYFSKYSVADFIDGTVPPEAVKDKVVLFGMTALGLFDLRPTPFAANTPGVYIHASAIQNMIDGRFLERFYGLVLVEILAYLLLGLVMGVTMPRVPPWAGALLTVAFAVGLYWFDVMFIFARGQQMLNVLPTLQATLTFIGVAIYGYLTEGREKRKIRKAFQFYLTKSVVDEMLKEPEKLKLGGEKRNCTVLFSDIRGFTTISERLSPEQLTSLLNEYLTPMTNLVFKYDGTLDKYMGDAIMAIFGAPVAYEDHAARACFCALDMIEDLRTLQQGWRDRGVPELDIGIGLNTGDMAVGNMGSEVRFDYTVMGDNVNLGSRLEGINKQYGTNIIISGSTRRAAGDRVHVREMDSVRVKGKREPVVIFELLGKGEPPNPVRELITTFEEGIKKYKQQDWDGAVALFDKVRRELKPHDYASTMYIERCAEMRANPPGPDWDGAYTMTTK